MSRQSQPRPQPDGAAQGPGLDALSMAPSLLLRQSAAAALFGLDVFEANLRIWRNALDTMREVGRSQQDAALESLRTELKSGAPIDEASVQGASLFAPFLAARRAYEQIGGAVLTAQRQALDTMAEETRPH